MTEIDSIKARVAIYVNTASVKIDEFMLAVNEANEIGDLDFKSLGEIQNDLDRARKILKIEGDLK